MKRKLDEYAAPGQKSTEKSSNRPAKRAKFTTEKNVSVPDVTSHQKTGRSTLPTTKISSLFSSNPVIEQPTHDSKVALPALPSNAPLGGSSTFADLGVDPLLVAHLKNKMNILTPTAIQRASIPYMMTNDTTISKRDIFLQSQTGSGKTLSFLIPIIQDLLPLSGLSYINRSIGTIAVIIAPTRELARQISDVLEALLKLRLRPYEENPDDKAEDDSPRLTRWLVSGLFTGGSTRAHEKSRIRKGLPIIVSTPGRLLDHLQNTSSFNVGKCRWLVLDEADRLMELGFQDTIDGILRGLEGRRRLALQSVKDGTAQEVGDWDWYRERRTILCSATIRSDVQDLAGRSLQTPLFINTKVTGTDNALEMEAPMEQPTIPAQLTQLFSVVPLKLRLVTLISLIRATLAKIPTKGCSKKVIVFFSCTDSVDFHLALLSGVQMRTQRASEPVGSDEESSDEGRTRNSGDSYRFMSALLPSTALFKLHGSMSNADRKESLKRFLERKESSILLSTSVASRGLDLPYVESVIQYDLPTENGHSEYVHRIGRTARAGQGGESWAFVAPSEMEWSEWLESKLEHKDNLRQKQSLQQTSFESILKDGFGGDEKEAQSRATEVQLAFERYVTSDKKAC